MSIQIDGSAPEDVGRPLKLSFFGAYLSLFSSLDLFGWVYMDTFCPSIGRASKGAQRENSVLYGLTRMALRVYLGCFHRVLLFLSVVDIWADYIGPS